MTADEKQKKIVKYFNDVGNIKNRDRLVKNEIRTFMTHNHDFLSSNGFGKSRPIIPKQTQDKLRTLYTPKGDNSFKMFVKDHPLIDPSFNKVASNPIKLGLTVSYINTKDRTYPMMILLMEFTSKMYKYFVHGINNPDKLQFIIDNKLTNQWLIKKYPTIDLVLSHMLDSVENRFKTEVMTGQDGYIIEFINSISTRINEMFKKIKNIYTNTSDSSVRRYSNDGLGADIYDETNNNTLDVNRLQNAVTHLIIQEKFNKQFYKSINKGEDYSDEIDVLFHENIDLVLTVIKTLLDEYIKTNKVYSIATLKKNFVTTSIKRKLILPYIDELSKWYGGRYTKVKNKRKWTEFSKSVEFYIIMYMYRSIVHMGGK